MVTAAPTHRIHDVLAQYRKVSFDEYDKGANFERLIQAFLRTDAQYAALFDEVWLWSEYPDRSNRTDTGVDLVARNRDTGELTAVQCKFFAPTTTVTKAMLDSFLSASGKAREDGSPEFASRLIVSTSDHWGKNAESAIANQNIPVERLRVQDMDESSIDWSQFVWTEPGSLTRKTRKAPFDYQTVAIANVVDGFESHDRGKLIMACGTGKTFTSLRLSEKLVESGGIVLFLVPSIALLSQTLKEWTIQAEAPIRAFAVCSDVSVGKRRTEEDIPVTDLAYPATTSAPALVKQLQKGDASDRVTVVFSTYQSLAVISQAQCLGLPEFDLIVCDEAHRTTGAALSDEDESAFMKVHDQQFVRGKRRLYMTATPRIFSDGTRKRAGEVGAKLADMDDEGTYGPEFHRLGFGEAVSLNRLTDYKVLVLAVDEGFVAREFQSLMSRDGYELAMEDTAKIVGTWNGLAKRSVIPGEYDEDPSPMQRAVMFAKDIKTSKRLAETFQEVVEGEIQRIADAGGDISKLLHTEAQHVDGTQSMLVRNAKIDWLKEAAPNNTVRILSNVKCLSEGVDVPALDAVMFMNPRKSVVDVVQSVGRVMRKMAGKRYGYVILPIAVSSGVAPEEALNDNEKYRVVWQVLQALRAHDERFDAEVNKIDLTKKTDRLKIDVIGVGGGAGDDDGPGAATAGADKVHSQPQLDFSKIEAWRDAILSKIVQKVGERRYWETWAKDVAEIAQAHTARIHALVDGRNKLIREEFEAFTEGLRLNLNPDISSEDAVQMLSQHLITQPVFDALFEGYAFSENNPVSKVMNRMVEVLDGANLGTETDRLEKFYESVRTRAERIEDAAAKQTIVKELYEKFFSTAFSKTSAKLGIVYTPNEIVDFVLHSVDDILHDEFDSSLSDEGVHVLDPFTGTGTFIVRLLQSGLIRPEDIARKYRGELHANEIVLLAYYVAAINIEEAYHSLRGGEYVPFEGIVLTDTFQMFEDDDQLDDLGVFQANNDRVMTQKNAPIRVVVGNPPYSKGQTSGNDDNQNNPYPTLDGHIRDTYAARSTATNKNNLYDSYIRAIRWASDRIGDRGVVAYVSNGGYIDGNTADGLRLTLMDEFTGVYVLNLRGNQRTAGEQSRKEGGKIFGSGSRATIAVVILVKNAARTTPGRLRYHDIGDYLTRTQKLKAVKDFGSAAQVPWRHITPSPEGDWINQRDDTFASWTPVGDKDKAHTRDLRVFATYSAGLKTNRDAWVYGFSKQAVVGNVTRMVDFYNTQVEDRQTTVDAGEEFTHSTDPTKFSWNRTDLGRLSRGRTLEFRPDTMVYRSMYRPFVKERVAFDRDLNDMTYKLADVFPTPGSENTGIYLTSPGAGHAASALVVDVIPDLAFWGSGSGQFFPRYTYRPVETEPGALFPDSGQLQVFDDVDGRLRLDATPRFERVDNITDGILADYRAAYGPDVTKDDVFHYVYGLLHSPDYRARFEADLRKMLPRIPKVKAFHQFADAGRKLADLHLHYETADPWPLTVNARAGASLRVAKMRYGKHGRETDRSTVVYNDDITLTGVPERAHEYRLGSRSALDWILERYQVKTDKASGIVNDPNTWGDEHDDPRYILDLIGRITTVSVETVRIVDELPPLDIADNA